MTLQQVSLITIFILIGVFLLSRDNSRTGRIFYRIWVIFIILISIYAVLLLFISAVTNKNNVSNEIINNENLHAELVGFVVDRDGELYLNNFPFAEPNDIDVTTYILDCSSDLNINPYVPVKVTGYFDEVEDVIHSVEVSNDIPKEVFDNNNYLFAYKNLVDIGAISSIQKYTNLAMAREIYPDDENIEKEFNTIEDVPIDWDSIDDISPEDELLLSLSINCKRLFKDKDLLVAESIINQLNELITLTKTY